VVLYFVLPEVLKVRAQIVDPSARHLGVGDLAQRIGPSYLLWGLADDAGMLTHSSLAFSRSMCQIQLPKQGLSKARAPRGAMTKIENNVHIVAAFMLLMVRRPTGIQ